MIDSFVAAIRATPDDDLPRLIFADYLEERGNPRGEFIRAQIELTKLWPDDTRRDELLAREAELLREFESDWLGELNDSLYRWWFHRGFLEVSLDIRRFLDDQWLLNWPNIAGIHLHPPSYMEPELVLKLAGDPKATFVRSLYLGFEWVQDPVATALAQSEYFDHLASLDLGNNGITDNGVAALAASRSLRSLRDLFLVNNQITDAGAEAIAESSARASLRQLDLSNNYISSDGAIALSNSRHLNALSCLRLDGNLSNIAGM